MNREEVTALFERRGDAWARRDSDALAATHAEHGTADSPLQGRLDGRRRIRDAYEGWFKSFSDLTFTRRQLLIDDNRVAEFFTVHGTQSAPFHGMPATARRIELTGAWLFTLGADGLIASDQRVYDVTSMLVQLGVLKAKPAADSAASLATER